MSWLSAVRSRSSVQRFGVAAALGLVAVGLISAGAVLASTTGWRVQRSPNPSKSLSGVAATSSADAWAVGFDTNGTLIEYWNGEAWKLQANPMSSSSLSPLLNGVAATSSADAWAVGNYVKNFNVRTLIEHWNGKVWTVQPSPNRTSSFSELFGVAATSSTHAWAVGDYFPKVSVDHTLIEHWNGKAWKIQPSPNRTNDNHLYAVAAASSTNAWAVGDYSPKRKAAHTLIEHWNGTAWKIQRSPNIRGSSRTPFGVDNVLFGVAATSSTNAWAVGHTSRHGTLIEHWNGKAWKLQPSPNPGIHAFLLGVAAASRTNAWAVGYNKNISAHTDATLIEHWNGKTWKVQRSPNAGPLAAVTATSANNAWAIGGNMILHWNGKG